MLHGMVYILKLFCLFPTQVEVTLSTHDCEGLSDRDITMATFMNEISDGKTS